MAINYKQCPKCGSKNSVEIVYGMPSYELSAQAEAGKVMLGGCITLDDNPKYFCKDCEYKWNQEQAIDEAYSKIKTIKTSAGGFFSGYYNVIIDLAKLEITWSLSGGGQEDQIIHRSIREKTACKFINGLKMVNLLNWKAKYIESDICDGTQWVVEILTDVKTIKKQGSNEYPEEWELFCKLIREITRRKFE